MAKRKQKIFNVLLILIFITTLFLSIRNAESWNVYGLLPGANNAPVNDYCYTYDAVTGMGEWASCGTGSQTPWTGAIDAGGFGLSNGGAFSIGDITASNYLSSTNLALASARYIVFQDGSNTKARNTLTGAIDSVNADPVVVIEYAMNNLTAGRTWKEKVMVIGDYAITSPIDIPSYTIIELRGRIKLADTGYSGTYMLTNADMTNGNNDIEIIGGLIDGNRTVRTTTNNCIQFTGASNYNIKIRDMKIKSCYNEGIQTFGTAYIEFTGNEIWDNGDDSLSILHGSNNGIITNNILHDNVSATGGSSGIELENGPYEITVSDNVIYSSSTSTAMNGITLPCDSGCVLDARDITITGNVIRNVSGHGIIIQSQISDRIIEAVTISNNIISDTAGNGIYNLNTNGGIVRNINLSGNVIERAGTNTDNVYGIWLYDVDNITIANNHVSESGDVGIYISGSPTEIQVTGNAVLNNGNFDDTATPGIYVGGASTNHIYVRNNIVNDTQATKTQSGITVSAATDNIYIENNDVSLTDEFKIQLNSGAVAKLRGNVGYQLYEGAISGCVSYSDSANTDASNQVLKSCALETNISTNADSIEFEAAFTFAANANSKQIKIALNEGSVSYIWDSTAQAENATELVVKGVIVRANSTSARMIIYPGGSASTMALTAEYNAIANNSWATATALEFYGDGDAAGDITQTLMRVKYMGAP